jgi:hypothetical protein
MKRIITILTAVSLFSALYSQSIIEQPYLQDAEPSRITVMWETSSNTESWVD